ncbi:MAG: hypothetical protein IJA92_00775, partial [Oscillospiraceae bacterium]|nr:hypothetical protein [Oscillospiraceae bacterium]
AVKKDWGILFLLPVFAKTPHPSAPQTPSPQGEGCPSGCFVLRNAEDSVPYICHCEGVSTRQSGKGIRIFCFVRNEKRFVVKNKNRADGSVRFCFFQPILK